MSKLPPQVASARGIAPQELPAEDLGDIMKPGRGTGLADLVPQAEPPQPSAPTPVPAPSPAEGPPPVRPLTAVAPLVEEPVSAADRRARRPGRPRTRSKPSTAVYVSAGVKNRFEKYRHSTKSTNLDVVLEAISAKHQAGELAAIIDESRYSTARSTALFPSDPSAVRYLGGGSSQIAFSPTAEQDRVIDEIGAQLGFNTRSTWIAPVLNAFLPGRRDTSPGA